MGRGPRAGDDARESEVLIEIVTVGTFAKVSAIDTESGLEVSITGPANADRSTLEAAALAKLDYMLKKKRLRPKPR
jgi:hypothetical protein